MIRGYFIVVLLSAALMSSAQSPDYLELVKKETQLETWFEILYSDTLSDPGPVLEKILNVMSGALSMEGAMEYPWSKLDRIGVIRSEDKRLRVFTWHIMDDPDHYRYFGFMQINPKKDQVSVVELKDNQLDQSNVKVLDQTTDDWYGKLYYSVVTNNYKRRTYYTLLGMDFNNTSSTIKTVETITLQRNRPRFEKGMYHDGNETLDRMVFEYSSQVSMSVRYDPGLKMITCDHLEPFHPIYRNNFEFYGPDGSFDGLEFRDGSWDFEIDIDARNLD